MKVLHISHTGLPDPRIERLAVLSKEYVKSYFLGAGPKRSQLFDDAFEEVFFTNSFDTPSNIGIPVFFGQLRRKIEEFVNRIDPDIVYAHNIVTAKIAHDLSIPFVYDDHEYWSRQSTLRRLSVRFPLTRIKNAARYFWIPRIYRRWEREILGSAKAVVTVSDAIASEHKKHRENCTVIPNLPLKKEIGNLIAPEKHQGPPNAICLAANFGGFLEHRYPGNHRELWEREGGIHLDWVGDKPPLKWKWIRHREWINPSQIIDVLTKNYQFGLIPWTDFWYHRYSFPNKAATYSLSGLIFVLNRDFYSIIRHLPKWGLHTYKNSTEFIDIMRSIKKQAPEEILTKRRDLQNWASENMILNKYTDTLRNVISIAS